MSLRPYQQAAVQAVYHHLQTRDDNPVVVLPTAAGKSWVIAQLVTDTVCHWQGRVLVLAHVKELLEQNAEKIQRLCPHVSIGLYSAGLNRRDTDTPVLIAGIQSVYKKAYELGAFDLVIVDEAHLIPPDNDSMYQTLLAALKENQPHLRVVGLTATPFRLTSGPICTPDGILNHICYEISIRELICDGYLCPLITKTSAQKVDFQSLRVHAGEFIATEVEQLMDEDWLVAAACKEILMYTHNRRSVLVFTSGRQHGQHVAKILRELSGQDVGFIDSQTPSTERAELIARFRYETARQTLFEQPLQPLKFLVNVNVLTTGFDAPNIDCVAILRPTMSPGLWYQMVGRGFRTYPGKQNCLILDFGGNALRHGPVDCLILPRAPGRGVGEAPAKECPQCHTVIALGYAACPDCGYQFPPPERKRHTASASNIGVLSGHVSETEYEVLDIRYGVYQKRNAPPGAPNTMRVEYKIANSTWISEWICFEHTGYPRWKAEQWWKQRSPDPVPDTAQRAVEIAQGGGLAYTKKIRVRYIAGEKYERIVGYQLGPMPEPVPVGDTIDDLSDIPF